MYRPKEVVPIIVFIAHTLSSREAE